MMKITHVVTVFVLLFIFSPLFGEEQSLGTTFTDKILSNEFQISDKLSLLSKEYYQIKKKDAMRLMEYLKTCDKDIFIPISALILQHKEHFSYAGEIYNLMLTRRKELVSKPEDVLPFMTYLSNVLVLHRTILSKGEQDSGHLSDKLLKDYERLTDELLGIIYQMPPEAQEKTINIIFPGDSNNGLLELLQITNGERIIKNALKSIESGDEHEIKSSLLILCKIDISSHSSDESFLSKIAPLTLHGNSKISNLSNEILERCTGVEGGSDFNWSDWLSKNTLAIRGDVATDKLKNPNLSISERINALDLVCSANYNKWSETSNAFETIVSILHDDNTPFPLRSELLGRLVFIASLDTASAPGKQSKLNKSILESIRMMFNVALKKNDKKWLMRTIGAVSSPKIKLLENDSKIRNEIYTILANDSYERQIQLTAALGLSQVRIHRREAAQKLLDFYERHKIFSDEESIQILLALQEITGKPAQNNKTLELVRAIDYWRKAVSSMPDDPPEEKEGK